MMRSTINLPCTTNGDSFFRFVPFGDGREVIVRRGKELGFRYGFELSRREVEVGGHRFPLVRHQSLLSPPPHMPNGPPLTAEAAKSLTPESDVLHLPDAEVLIRREPNGFTDAEVDTILNAISLT